MLRIVLVDDHPVMLEGIKAILSEEIAKKEIEIVNQYYNGADLIESDLREVNLVILDLQMPGMNGWETAKWLKENRKRVKMVVFSHISDAITIQNFLKLGVHGYVLKSTGIESLSDTIKKVMMSNEPYACPQTSEILAKYYYERSEWMGAEPSKRQLEVLQLLWEGKTNGEIAKILKLSQNTIATYRADLYDLFEVDNLVVLLRLAIKRGYLQESLQI